MNRPTSIVARSLEPLVNALWLFFLVWSVVVAGLWLGGEGAINSLANRGLRDALTLVAGASDAIWLVLATANVYLHLADKEGLPRARVVALSIGVITSALAAASVWSGYPLGTVFYTARLGMKLGPVPLGWPLIWFIVVIGGRDLAGRAFPRVSERTISLITGGLALLTSINLDPIATQVRLYWFWYAAGTHQPSQMPWYNTATWFAATAALTWYFREQKVVSRPMLPRPAAILVIVNFLLILAHLRQLVVR